MEANDAEKRKKRKEKRKSKTWITKTLVRGHFSPKVRTTFSLLISPHFGEAEC